MTDVTAGNSIPHIDLAVSFDLKQSTIRGTAKISLPPGETLNLYLADLKVTGAALNRPDRENLVVTLPSDNILVIPEVNQPQTLLLSYEKQVADGFLNAVTPASIVLTSGWHPIPDRPVTYSLEAALPAGFTAISESDTFQLTTPDGIARFSFSQPVYSLTLAAAPYEVRQRLVREGLTLYTLFFPEEAELAEGYLDSAADYVRRYEKQIGPFPYNHYAIVENLKPTGFGLPTFTLLGQQVIRLPFIRRTSLGHEILHSWFGNNIDVDHSAGNWSEGLTTYLADLAYRNDAGEGVQARKETIQNFLDYVTPETPPLQDFYSAGHDRRSNRQDRAVGYGRSAMLFHELKGLIGADTFDSSIRRFYREFTGRSASWTDIRELFEQESSRNLETFFSQRLLSNSLPVLRIADLKTRQTVDRNLLSFTIVQDQDEPFELMLRFVVKTISGEQFHSRIINSRETEVSVELDTLPLELVIDPEYDIMRQLSYDERAPTWSSIIGAEHSFVVLEDEKQRDIFAPFLELVERYDWHVETAADINREDLQGHNLIFLGTGSDLSRALFAVPRHPEAGFTVDVRFNPIERDRTVALMTSSSRSESEAVVRRLPHYGKYSFLHFTSGGILEKHITPSVHGIRYQIIEKPSGISTSALSGFEQLVEQLDRYRVVYIGEQHTSRADHLLQSLLIEALYAKNPDLVIGMEMFPRSSQQPLDIYINDPGMNETSFLKESRYYDVWRYDYRLFRPIFAFARKHRIPVIGLNLDRGTVSSMFKSGGADKLSQEQLDSLPLDRDLDMPGYLDRLSATLAMHSSATRSDGSLAGFIQAQALWDEGMAESIYNYLHDKPTTRMIVLAGSQHTRKDSGIPPRVARRIDLPQATVNNLATSPISGQELSRTTDYLFLLDVEDFPAPGKIGIVLQKIEAEPGMQILEVNPVSNAASAGVRSGDVLVEIDGLKINNMVDVRAAMLDRNIGESISVSLSRKTEAGNTEELRLEITLFDPAAVKPHP